MDFSEGLYIEPIAESSPDHYVVDWPSARNQRQSALSEQSHYVVPWVPKMVDGNKGDSSHRSGQRLQSLQDDYIEGYDAYALDA